jgi:hypothetical protein
MKPDIEEPPVATVYGTVMQLGEHHLVAVYRRAGVSWVAEFRDDRGELSDPASWFRSGLGTLRYSHGARAKALDAMTTLTPEIIQRIEALHQLAKARDESAASVLAPLTPALRRIAALGLRAMRGGGRLHRV